MDGSVLEEKSSFKMLGLTFCSKLDWGFYIVSIAKTASKKIGALVLSMKFFLLRLLCISINLAYDLVWNTVVMSGLVLLVATWNCWITASLEPLAHHQNVASLSLFCRYYFCRYSSELAQLVPLPYSQGRSTHYSDRLHDFSVTIPRWCQQLQGCLCQQFLSLHS